MNFVVIGEFHSNPIYRIVTKFGNYDKIWSLLVGLQKNQRDYNEILFTENTGFC